MKNTDKGSFVPLLVIIAILAIAGIWYLVAKHMGTGAQGEPINYPDQSQASSTPSTVGTKQVTMVSPNGGERLVKGKTYKISWTTSASSTFARFPQVSLTLIAAKGQQAVTPDQTIVADNTGSVQWTVPSAQLSAYVQDEPSGPYSLRTLDDQTQFQFLIEGYPHTTGRAEGPFDYTDGSFRIVSP